MDIDLIREDFPLLDNIAYLDNAATSLSPEPVIRAMNEFERHYRSNVGRGVHRLTTIATQRYWDSHIKVAELIGGEDGTTVLTKNTTEAINMVACGLEWHSGDNIVTTVLEHHSNFLPWVHLRKKGIGVSTIEPFPDGMIDISAFESAINENTGLVALTHASNVLGNVLPVKEIASICQEHGARLLIDGAQSVPHISVDVKKTGCDYFCFSGHKMLGPTGTGILWMKETDIDPLLLGGGAIDKVSLDSYTLAEGYQRYEAGTPNIAGMIGLGYAVDYLRKVGMDNIERHEKKLTEKVIHGLEDMEQVHVYGPVEKSARIGVVSFNIEGMHPHEVSHILDEGSDMITRSGEHCCHPLMEYMGLPNGTVRISMYLYNTEEEIDLLLATIEEITRRL
ncbi:aminotransferase class V-fold PLP-dependent enzyme [Methanolobus halotolerans]|uniref:cysteine desulfurase n=1 Tax=Methanolobus halotolerans TaxID=2052935 RepID=A0A4E0Q8V8_9EURY|nr:cysteine desulfurase [Methanolobus halotolerans]TGC11330.1 cysteine desulfurase [Methanolobus halotolerans]